VSRDIVSLFGSFGAGPAVGGTGMAETLSAGFRGRDLRSGSVKRVASAVWEGANAVRLLHDFLVRAGRR
jgi:hypothetical protein